MRICLKTGAGRRLAVAALCVFVAAVPVRSQTPPAPKDISFDDAIREALEKNLNLLAEKYNVPVAEARIVQARLRPNPVFTTDFDYIPFGTQFTPENAAGPTEFSFRLDYLFERGGKRERRVEVAEDAKSVAQLQLLNTTRQLVLDVANAFVDVQAAKESLALAQENLRALNEIVNINATRVKAGDLAQVELIRSRLAALQFRNSVRSRGASPAHREDASRTRSSGARRRPSSMSPDPFAAIRRCWCPKNAGAVARTSARPAGAPARPGALAGRNPLQLAQGKVDYTVGAEYHRQFYNGTGSARGRLLQRAAAGLQPQPGRNRAGAAREQEQIETRIRALEAAITNEVDSAFAQYSTSRDLLREHRDHDACPRRATCAAPPNTPTAAAKLRCSNFWMPAAFNDTMQAYNEARADYARSLYLIDSVSGRR